MKAQKGSVHIIIVIVLVVALLGALGYIAWQNFSKEDTHQATAQMTETTKDADKNSTAKPDEQPAQSTYKNGAYTFNYLTDGWTLDEERFGDSAPLTPQLKTADYEQAAMGVDKGAIITVYAYDETTTIDKKYAEVSSKSSGYAAEDVQKKTLNGVQAVSYHSAYEGIRYHTVFVGNNKVYDVVYMYESGGNASTHMDAYDHVTASFTIL